MKKKETEMKVLLCKT